MTEMGHERHFRPVGLMSASPLTAAEIADILQPPLGAKALNRYAIARCAGSLTVSAVTGGKIVKT